MAYNNTLRINFLLLLLFLSIFVKYKIYGNSNSVNLIKKVFLFFCYYRFVDVVVVVVVLSQ